MVDLSKLKSLAEWPKGREEVLKALTKLLSKLPEEHAELQIKVIDEFPQLNYVRKRVNYFVDDWARVSAWLFVPDGKDMVPGILCCHQRVPQGKDEPAGITGDRSLALAAHYAEQGYATLAPDCITAGERISPGLAPYDTSNFYKDQPKMSAAGKMLVDHMHALDLLAQTRNVDSARLGVVGHGLGGFNALLLAALDERVQACVSSCGFTRFADDAKPERWTGDNGFITIPKLESSLASKEYPLDWEHILALAAPNPTLVMTALNDPELSNTKSCEKAVKLARKIYGLLGEKDALEIYTHKNGRCIDPEGLLRADEWFERWL